MSFTEVQDTDRLVLVQLDYPSLLNACQVDVYMNSICRDDYFWMVKSITTSSLEQRAAKRE